MFEIDQDIRRARTLASEFYTGERFLDLSKELIFSRAWHFLGHDTEFGTLTPKILLAGLLNEPVLVSRQESGIKCLSNVCTHRGKILIEEACEASLIRCGYHGRRFSLDGRFLSMPEFEGVEDFPGKDDDLAQLLTAEWKGFHFVSVTNPYAAFDELTTGVSAGDFSYPELRLTSRKEYEVNAHWALYCENYLEGFHIPYVHKSLNEVVDYGTYTTEIFRYSSLQTGRDDNGAIAGRYLFIFPNTMFNFYPWGISVNVVRPVSPSKSVVEFLSYVSDESLIEKSAGADLHGVEMEDEAVVESVQRGIRSRFYSRGRYSPTREQGTHHFHRLIADFMFSRES